MSVVRLLCRSHYVRADKILKVADSSRSEQFCAGNDI